jgi:hypothetical protein
MAKPLVSNAADPEQVKTAAKKVRNKRVQELEDFIKVMSTVEGRRFMWRLLDHTGFQKSSFTGNSTTFFNEGMRNIGLIIWSDINEACPDLYIKMLQEAKELEKLTDG